jgi:glucose/arabinose dehydrogenase
MSKMRRARWGSALLTLLLITGLVPAAEPVVAAEPRHGRMLGADAALEPAAVDPPSGFQDTVVISGLTQPMAVRFASDGRVFVPEKSGIIKVFSSLNGSPTTLIDLRTQVFNFWDRGLLGFALDPDFPASPYAYVLYTYNALPGGSAPQWPASGANGDSCPANPGSTSDGCVVTSRLARLLISGNTATVDANLITDWCQQYPSHSAGTLAFGDDGSLYVSHGEGANFNSTDYGQWGGTKTPVVTPANPCDDPPSGSGTALAPPTAQGGALRAQDVALGSDPVTLDGAILRIDPDTGAGVGSNPLAGSGDANARRIIAHGLRNPFRFAVRPGTNELWIGDVGWDTWEEIDRYQPGALRNFGWPCYEGSARTPPYDALDLTACEDLYAAGTAVGPHVKYQQGAVVSPTDGTICDPSAGSSIAGLVFYAGGPYPDQYDGALFFADHNRDCLWVLHPGAGGVPDTSPVLFASGVTTSVDLTLGPSGDIFWTDFQGGTIHRIRYLAGNGPPVASFTRSPTSGQAPLTVNFNASASNDPDSDPLTFDWDLDGDGTYEIINGGVTRQTTYGSPGTRTVRLRVKDPLGAEGTTTRTVSVGSTTLPVPVIDTPKATMLWSVGQTIAFSGHATDQQDGTLPASNLDWELILHHCHAVGDCHEHPITDFSGVANGTFQAPDHAYPTEIELRLTATDSSGGSVTVSRRIDPATVVVTLQTGPSGGKVVFDSSVLTTTVSRRVIRNSTHTVSVATPQSIGGASRAFVAWSDGGAVTHTFTASSSRTLTAWFTGGDTTRPAITLLRVGGLTGEQAGSVIPSRIRWTATDFGGTGIAGYALEVSSNGGSTWTRMTLSPTNRTSFDIDLSQGVPYRFRVKARDKAGNWGSAWTTSAVTRLSAAQETSTSMSYTSGAWSPVSDGSAWGGGLKRSSTFGAAMTYRFTGRAISWVAPRGTGYGLVRIYLDGVLRTTVDLGSGSGARRIAFSADFGASGTHTLRIANLATAGRSLVDHDAVIVYR